nr:MAG TPA: hypothetical protein [Caudoviricetes sp.]
MFQTFDRIKELAQKQGLSNIKYFLSYSQKG